MKIDFCKDLLDLEGKSIGKANKVLAQELVSGTEGDSVKLLGWALKLSAGEVLELDKSDQATLKEHIRNSKTITVLGKGRLLEMME